MTDHPGPDYLTRLAPLRAVEPQPLDPARVRERLTELDRSIDVQERIVDRLDTLLDDERRELARLTGTRDGMRRHPAVRAALTPPREDPTT